ncbi:MAG TPA: PIG-L family deacetylase [Thermoanaerobaculia bacterium]|nr:PIG-L family deacetylase [Thermoanaerobaculia bacterium]
MWSRRFLLPLLLLLLATAAQGRTASELQLAMKRLTVLGSALYVAAHPDDENTAMLAWLVNERLLRTAYLSVTRGDGGQNLIGNEKGALLGVIRTQELLAARRIDHAEQFFTRAVDFGYSKTAEETLRIWNRDAVLADVVWTIRSFQPDVIITRFPATGEGGHGHHTASGLLAEEAFRAAGDPKRFPEQLRHVSPWQPRRLFWNRFSWQRIDPDSPLVANDLRADLGTYNPLLGRSYTEIAAESRSQHKSQGFGSAERRGSVINYYLQIAGDPARKDLFEGIDTSWSRLPGGERAGAILQRAADTFDPLAPATSIPLLLEAHSELERLAATITSPWIEIKQGELLEVIRDAAGLSIDVSAAGSAVTPGGEISMSVSVVNRSDHPFTLSIVASPMARTSKAPGAPLRNNQPVRTELTIALPAGYPLSQPYWLRDAPKVGMFQVAEQRLIGAAQNPPSIPITVSLTDRQMRTLIFTVPAVHRRVDPVAGEQVRAVEVVPPVTINLDEQVYLFPDAKAKEVSLKLRSFIDGAAGTVRLAAPAGWRVAPAAAPLAIAERGGESELRFTVTPPAGETEGTLRAEVELDDGRKLAHGLVEIDYPHIGPQRLFPPAEARLVRAGVDRRGERIGYIMGSGDEVPESLRQAGFEVTLLGDAELDRGEFGGFDAIVAGVRAYNTRGRLRSAHARLMQYVAGGGTYVVQYNTAANVTGDRLVVPSPGPHSLTISRDRVSVEEAPVEILAPSHPILTAPNRITAADFDGWVQERGLYFPGEWDPRYETVIATADPGEPPKPGGLLVARHGKGVFVYTAYSFFRQLPAGVPGAYRLFVNLVSAR